ncbi:hypothetical protein PPN82_13960 [Proteus mirabilis]|uniref:hypothetical protein n=1 Tax=Proteus mirabilis TaxID=584 RepID=UPI001A1BD77F|nr:hypothetical protein [Proteus mirabilis]EGT3588465.1 hypothetical protein [Proteus mirabilis]MBI6367242.1 hypothetical protein [Proteus mirabilis]MDC5892213.1 hypothetical protein [Proteus mirabilis]MDC5913351.1 hypothetical protein [Proteus mirabilis]MDC6005299.1 hypothetical protein [Proteus mirabilis]
MTTLDFNLVSVIKNAGTDPSDITDAVWKAGYRKADFTTEQIIDITVSMTGDSIYLKLPHDNLPKTLDDISKYHLNDIIFDAHWDNPPATIAQAITENGYRKGDKK